MGDTELPYNASHQYAYRVPSPPRIFVPPPIQSSIDSPALRIREGRLPEPNTMLPNTTFIQYYEAEQREPPPRWSPANWEYADRQRAQQILPFLFLGPLGAARDTDFLISSGITMCIGVRKIMTGFKINPKAPRDLGLELRFVDITTEGELMQSFDMMASVVNEHLEQLYQAWQINRGPFDRPPGRVLVFCESGNERSATIVAAYLMTAFNVNVIEAIQMVQQLRFCINIDDDARTRLETYSQMIQARLHIHQAGQNNDAATAANGGLSVPARNVSRKRSAERMMDAEDEEMDMGDDEWKEGRDGSAPFRDSEGEADDYR